METVLGLDLQHVAFYLSGILFIACIAALAGLGDYR
jgi:hypothetical protein